MRRLLVAGIAVAVATAIVPGADAKTIKVNWRERTSFPSGRGYLAFHITRIVVTRNSWKVTASFTNRSKLTLRVLPHGIPGRIYPDSAGFLLATPKSGTAVPRPWELFRFRSAKPSFPTKLGAGKRWSGTFGGDAKLPHGRPIYIAFGVFVSPADRLTPFGWVTDHRFRL